MGNVQEVFENIDRHPLDVQLLYAAEYGDVDHLMKLLERHKNGEEFNIDVTSNYLWTPLFMAAKQGHADCVKLLLEAGNILMKYREFLKENSSVMMKRNFYKHCPHATYH